MRIIILTALIVTLGLRADAQDLHFTQYNMSGMQFNPAATGGFYGTFRVGGIYRSQWHNGFGTTLFSTPMLYIDAPVYRGFRKQDWFGVGMTYSQDNAGTLRIGRTSMLGSLSYHFSLDKKQRHVLTLGYQWGNHGFKVKNIQDAVPEDQITGGSSLDMINPEAESYQGSNLGLQFSSQLAEGSKLTVGAAMFRLSRARLSLLQSGGGGIGGSNRIPSRFVVHGGLEQDVGEQFLDNTSDAGKMLDAYVVSDLRLGYTLKDRLFKEMRFSLLVNNVFDARYSSNGYTYSYVYEGIVTENFYYPQAGINFLAGVDLMF